MYLSLRAKLIALFLLSSVIAFCQTPLNRGPASILERDANVQGYLRMIMPVYNDTTSALIGSVDSLGMLIQIRSTGQIWHRDTVSGGGHHWSLLIPSGGSVLYSDLTGLISANSVLQAAFDAKQNALGFVPLNPANNLSEVVAATAKTNLGISLVGSTNQFGDLSGLPNTIAGYNITDAVPVGRTLTINGVGQDLSTNRSWTVSASDSGVVGVSGVTKFLVGTTRYFKLDTSFAMLKSDSTSLYITPTYFNAHNGGEAGNGITKHGSEFDLGGLLTDNIYFNGSAGHKVQLDTADLFFNNPTTGIYMYAGDSVTGSVINQISPTGISITDTVGGFRENIMNSHSTTIATQEGSIVFGSASTTGISITAHSGFMGNIETSFDGVAVLGGEIEAATLVSGGALSAIKLAKDSIRFISQQHGNIDATSASHIGIAAYDSLALFIYGDTVGFRVGSYASRAVGDYLALADNTGRMKWVTPSSGSGTVTAVGGTTNRITSSGGTAPNIDISGAYVGQTSITTLGTIGTGTWGATTIGTGFGGTGLTSYTTNGIFYASSSSAMSQVTAPAHNNMKLSINNSGVFTWMDTTAVSGATYTFTSGLTAVGSTVTNNLSTGILHGQGLFGGTAASDTLNIRSTTNATPGLIDFGYRGAYYDEANMNLRITDSLGNSLGVQVYNNKLATASVSQNSPLLVLHGNGWKTAATAASQPVDGQIYMQALQGISLPSGVFAFNYSINGGASTNMMQLYTTGIQLAGAGAGAGLALDNSGPVANVIQMLAGATINAGNSGARWNNTNGISFGGPPSTNANSQTSTGMRLNFAFANAGFTSSNFSALDIPVAISLSGTTTGSLYRGVYVHPTLTGSPDFRAFESSAGKVVFNGILNSVNGAGVYIKETDSTATEMTFANLLIKQGINYGTSTQSGDGTTTVFNIAHGLSGVTSTSNVTVTARTGAAVGPYSVTTSSTNVIITYLVAPTLGTGNLIWTYELKP